MMKTGILDLNDAKRNIRSGFINQVSKQYPKIAETLKEIFTVCVHPDREKRIDVYRRILDCYPFGSEERRILFEFYAKIMDLERRVRKFHNAKVYDEKIENPKSTATADRFDYVFSRMAQENVDPVVVKKFFDENAYAIFSLTMHPTNPTSMSYTVYGGIEFDKYLDKNIDIEDHLQLIEELPLAGPKKTVFEEVEETIAILDIIYESAPRVRTELIRALEKYPLYREIIDVDKPLIQASIWSAGDGDGNENADIEALDQAVQQLKNRIKQLYLNDIEMLGSEKTFKIREKLSNNSYSSPEQLIDELKEFEDSKDLIYRIKNFRFHYAQIDIRHNAIDIMETLAHVLKINNLLDDLLSLSLNQQKTLIINWLHDEQIMAQLMLTDQIKLKQSSKTAGRIFGRLKLINNHLDIFNKLIIAETNSVVNVLAAFLLLKITGNSVAEKNTIIDIVTLSESVKDLEELPKLVSELIDDPIYRRHLSYRQKLIPMIAKSDTVRRNGRGAESSQEQALGTIYAMLDDIKLKYPELKHLTIHGFSGGGAALQRGGGRVTEVPHNQGRAARFFGAKTLGPSLLTIQGHQMQILFSPSSIALHTLQSLIAQNVHARAQTELKENGQHYVMPRRAPKGYDERKYIEKFFHACELMRRTYYEYMGDLDDETHENPGNQNFDRLFSNAPWVSVILGNLSSRPSKRGAGKTINEHPTVKSIRGEKPKLLNNRAITVERVSAHSGTHFLNYFSVYEGFHDLDREQLHAMYLCSKSCRDFMRNTALSLHMTDFDIAWHGMIGKHRPNKDDLQVLASRFIPDRTAYNSDEEILAWLECYAFKVAQIVYRCILNEEPNEHLTLQTPLECGFPSLAVQLKIREQSNEFGRYAEADITHSLNSNLDMIIEPCDYATIQACYAAADVVNAPEGGLNIELTRKQPV